MIPILYDKNEKEYKTNGIGRLICESCEVDETLNDKFELSMDLPITCKHFKDVQLDMQILATCEMDTQPQPFRIYDIKKKSTGIYQIKAEHISYWLNHIPVAPPSSGKTTIPHPTTILKIIKNNSIEPNPFTFTWDSSMENVSVESKREDAQFEFTVPKTARSLLGDDDNSGILGVFKTGEYKFDRYNVHLYERRGKDTDVTIRYGKNIQTLDQDENIENTVTGVYVYYRKENTSYNSSGSAEKENRSQVIDHSSVYVDAPRRAPRPRRAASSGESFSVVAIGDGVSVDTSSASNVDYVTAGPLHSDNYEKFSYPRTEIVDASSIWDHTPNQFEIDEYMHAWADAKMLGVPELDLNIDFVSLWQKKEYEMIKSLEKLHLGDSVRVIFPQIDVLTKGEITEYTWDVLGDCYTKFVIGNSVHIADTILNYTKAKAKKDVEYIAQKTSQSSVEQATVQTIEHSKLYTDEKVETIDKDFKETYKTVNERMSKIEKSDTEIRSTVEENTRQVGNITGKVKDYDDRISTISQTADNISTEVRNVSKRVDNTNDQIATVTENVTSISQKADNIRSEVSKKVDKNGVIQSINSYIEQTAGAVKIKADAIDLSGRLKQTGSVTLDSDGKNVELHLRKDMKIEGNVHTDSRPTVGSAYSEVLVRSDVPDIVKQASGGSGGGGVSKVAVYLYTSGSSVRYETAASAEKNLGSDWKQARFAFYAVQ